MKIKVMATFFLVIISFTGYYIYEMINSLQEEKHIFQEKIVKLKERFIACETTCKEPICGTGDEYQGDVRYIDCGESFIERWATCVCTTMCLEDFTVVVTNRSRCRDWPSVPIQIRPEPKEEEEEDEE
jgi:hypothetical protein